MRAALAIRDWIQDEKELQVRIAVSTGEALITLGARPGEGEGMAAGDVVNTTARLQAAAPVNGILVGEQTFRATRDAIDYREVGPVEAKGKAQPLAAWEALQARARFGVGIVRSFETELVGRATELSLLRDALARARQECSPQLVTLVGEPGIGKSRLVYELFAELEKGPDLTYWRQGRSLPYGDGVTLWALAEMVKAQAGVLETDAPDAAEEKLEGAAQSLLGSGSEASWVADRLRPLIGLSAEAELHGDRRGESFAAWRRFFEAMAEQHPLVLVFEDLHWADENLLDFVDYLVEYGSGVPLLVLATARPELLERRTGWGGGKRNAATISLSPLSGEDTARLVAALLERPVLPAEAQSLLLGRAGGNPLYAEQYAAMLKEQRDGEELRLPESIHGIIAARLDLLSPDEKGLLQDAAVVGKVFWSGALAAIGGRETWLLEERLHSLERKEFLQPSRRSSVGEEREYAFRHLLVRDVAYGQIPRAERAEKHRLAAEWIESLGRPEDHAEMLAHHYLAALELAQAAGEPSAGLPEQARIALREAGDRASGLNAFAAAARFYAQALELWPEDDGARPGLLFRYGKALFQADAAGADVLTTARDELLRAGDRETAAEADILLADLAFREGDRDHVSEHLAAAAALVAESPPSRAKALVLAHAARYHMLAENVQLAVAAGEEALSMAEPLGLDEIRAHVLDSIGAARARSDDPRGVEALEESIRIAVEINSPECVRGYINLSVILYEVGDLARNREVAAEAKRAAERFGEAHSLRWLRGFDLTQDYHQGRWDEAGREATEWIRECEEGSPHYHETAYRLFRGLIRFARGDVDGALEDAAAGVAVARRGVDPQQLWPTLSVRARLRFEAGQTAEATADVDELLTKLWRSVGRLGHVDLAWVVGPLDRREEFLDAIDRSGRSSRWLDAARAVASDQFELAADLFAEIGSAPSEALARLRAAEQLLAAGRRAEADIHLQKALAFFRAVDAARYVREGEALLAASA